jgi:hypothetical protein
MPHILQCLCQFYVTCENNVAYMHHQSDQFSFLPFEINHKGVSFMKQLDQLQNMHTNGSTIVSTTDPSKKGACFEYHDLHILKWVHFKDSWACTNDLMTYMETFSKRHKKMCNTKTEQQGIFLFLASLFCTIMVISKWTRDKHGTLIVKKDRLKIVLKKKNHIFLFFYQKKYRHESANGHSKTKYYLCQVGRIL